MGHRWGLVWDWGLMSFPQFAVSQVSEAATNSISAVVRVLNSLITNLSSIFSSITSRVQLDSIVLNNIQLSQGVNVIPHTLNRTLTGWKITRINGVSNIYDLQSTSANDGVYLYLNSSAAVQVSIEVF